MATMSDSPSSTALASLRQSVEAFSLEIALRDLIARGKVIRGGSQFATAEAQIFDKDGKLIASGRGTYFTAPPKPA